MSFAGEPYLLGGTPQDAGGVSTYLVTGCAGFIGSHLAEALLDRGDAVIGIDSFTDYYRRERKEENLAHLLGKPRFAFLEADVSEAPLASLIEAVDGVFHLAAQPGVRGSWGRTFSIYVRDNLIATQRIFEAAARAEKRVVFVSSSSVYGNAESYPTTEDLTPRPVSPYGVTKLCCEQLAQTYSEVAGLDFIALRYFTVYGPRQRPDMATERIVRALLDGGRFDVYGTGEQSRDVTYVEDAVRATITTMEVAPSGRIYNIGGGSETTLKEIIAMCETLSGCKLDVRYAAPAAGDVRRTASDAGLIQRDTGWTAQIGLEEGLATHLAWAASSGRVLPAAA